MWKWLKRVFESTPFKFPAQPPWDKIKRIGICDGKGGVHWFYPEHPPADMPARDGEANFGEPADTGVIT